MSGENFNHMAEAKLLAERANTAALKPGEVIALAQVHATIAVASWLQNIDYELTLRRQQG